MYFAGCRGARHKQLPEGEIHRITQEFVFAANSTAPAGSEIHGEVGAFDKVANSADHIEIRIFEKRQGKDYPAPVKEMLQKFSSIAAAHDLTQDNPTENGNAIVVNYRHAGFISHVIHVHLMGKDEASEPESVPASQHRRSPRLLQPAPSTTETAAIGAARGSTPGALRESLLQPQNQGTKLELASEPSR
jgi:hypothetical protein